MPPTKRSTTAKTNSKKSAINDAPLGFEEKLWAATDKMRGHMDAAKVIAGFRFCNNREVSQWTTGPILLTPTIAVVVLI